MLKQHNLYTFISFYSAILVAWNGRWRLQRERVLRREDQVFEDVLKIFNNAKGLVENNIEKWQEEEQYSRDLIKSNEDNPNSYFELPLDHAAGQYEPIPHYDNAQG